MAGIGHRHRPVVLVASPGASLLTAVEAGVERARKSRKQKAGGRRQGMQARCSVCGYDKLWVDRDHGQREVYDERDDLRDENGMFAGYGDALTECPECGAELSQLTTDH